MKDKKWVLVIIVIFIVIGIVFYIMKKNTVTFTLLGEKSVSVQYGTPYDDPGFIAKDGFGKNLNNYVVISNNLNTSIPGTYMIYYELNYNNKKTLLERIIYVNNEASVDDENIDIVLNGDEVIYLLKGATYNELGITIYNKSNNTVINSGSLSISSDIDVDTVGEYDVVYNLIYKDKTYTKTRKVKVFDISYSVDNTELTNKSVKITLDLNNVNNYSKTILPNGSSSSNKNIEYEVKENGKYSFKISLLNNEEIIKDIIISNIIDSYSCRGEITTTGTKLTVIPSSSSIKEYKWITNNETVNGNSTYLKAKIINNASVKLTFESGKSYTVNCKIEDKLVYHFKYDEKNTKPFMRSDTYTSGDKQRLDNMLKKVVSEAGYGTRAGVVAAARFIVGALDYKVPYQGGSYYNVVGLNIGQNGAWGSSGKGLDCYSFVMWARSQNGLPDDALYSGKKYNTYDEVNNIRVGDYLLTPCSGTCKNPYKINHIGIVIGVDSEYIYVAESKTVDINALVVTKLDKKNLPRKYNLSIVSHVTYPKEGNVTNMWIS